jgi:V8-like Glu-specific endopeptidase
MAGARELGAAPGARAVVSADPWVAGARRTAGGAVTRTTGRVFFTLDGTDYSCSGSTVDSANADVVITAAHCLSDGRGKWATHWIFVPGYSDGHEPFGAYPARAFFAASGWQHGADENDDIAFVAVGPASAGSGSVGSGSGLGFDRKQVRLHVVDVVGGQQIEFGSRAATEVLFGYPSVGQYHGRYLDYCDGTLSADPYGSPDAGIECTMTAGASGGPWFSGFDPLTGLGTISGVTTFRYSGSGGTLYSVDLGSVDRKLFDQAQHARDVLRPGPRSRGPGRSRRRSGRRRRACSRSASPCSS